MVVSIQYALIQEVSEPCESCSYICTLKSQVASGSTTLKGSAPAAGREHGRGMLQDMWLASSLMVTWTIPKRLPRKVALIFLRQCLTCSRCSIKHTN